MTKNLRLHLLRRVSRKQSVISVSADDLPPVPDAWQLGQAMAAAKGGRVADCEQLSLLLIAIDMDANSGAASAAEVLLRDAGPALWCRLDEAARRSWWRAPGLAQSARDRVTAGQAGILGLVVASFHPSGFVREAATARLGEFDGPLAACALALRTCDWVREVRDRARTALVQRLSSAEGLLAVGPFAISLAGRVHGRWLAGSFEAAMAALGDKDLARLRKAPDWRVRRAAYDLALAGNRLDIGQLLRAAGTDGDLVVRARCADAAIRAAAAIGDLALVRPLSGSGTAAVRAAAIYALAQAGDSGAATAALTDRNPLVREIAQGAVRRAGMDPVAMYRELLTAGGPNDPGAVAGLGEVGTTADSALIRPALNHPEARGRTEAIRALRRLSAIDPETAAAMLRDPSAAVTRQAALSLRPFASAVPLAVLQPLLADTVPSHVRSAAYRVLRERDTWTRVLTDLQLYDDQNGDLRSRARGDIGAWLTREAATTYSMPTGITAQRLDELSVRLADSLGADRERLLRFHLGLTSTRKSIS